MSPILFHTGTPVYLNKLHQKKRIAPVTSGVKEGISNQKKERECFQLSDYHASMETRVRCSVTFPSCARSIEKQMNNEGIVK